MAISGVNPKCYILALFVRDDGVRFLLGDDPFEFKDNQLHFQQNTMANDVVEVQGNDGYLLAGQVRRPGTQVFDGYVCNGTNSKEEVEAKRRAFLQFFRRSHFYKVIYVFPNGTAIQRKQGFLVDDPTVQELYQQYPEYHVALNFEDVNYYTYEEDDQGHEIYAKEAIVPLARGGATGGLIWDSYGVVWEDPWSLPLSISGVQFQILNNAGTRAPIDNVELYGDTYQQTYSGKNLFHVDNSSTTIYVWNDSSVTVNATSTSSYINISGANPMGSTTFPAGTYTISTNAVTGVYTKVFRLRWGGQNYDQTILKNGSSVTFTAPEEFTIRQIFVSGISSGTTINDTFGFQLEESSVATSYEPYTGGIPAPNPDYPQTVQTVTGEQTVNVIGKNLLGMQNVAEFTQNGVKISVQDGVISLDGTANASTSVVITSLINDLVFEQGKSYTFSAQVLSGSVDSGYNFQIRDANNTNVVSTSPWYYPATYNNLSGVGKAVRLYYGSGRVFTNYKIKIQVEQGSSATTYEPYQSQSYPINLGSIELCKIGDYQDYIYKSGNDWYVHKECGEQAVDTSAITLRSSYSNIDYAVIAKPSNSVFYGNYQEMQYPLLYTHAEHSSPGGNFNNASHVGKIFMSGQANNYWVGFTKNTNLDSIKSILNGSTLYYPLAIATDTQIADATLVGQLEALGTMELFIGENNVLVSTPTPDLPATLAFDYYTKFATIGAEWEEGGTKGATIVNVDAIDNTYPVWELTGPATNPTLSVLTTNTALTYNGTITASQKLVIDMFNKTATLNGTSVIGNISGDFVYMAPGTNRLAYTAGNTDAPDSTIYWQEVVG